MNRADGRKYAGQREYCRRIPCYVTDLGQYHTLGYYSDTLHVYDPNTIVRLYRRMKFVRGSALAHNLLI